MNSPDTAVIPTPPLRSRDADGTRQLLLDAARRRFAKDGYRTTTVRDIATDAGVNVALISRYFASKEGLFEACLTHAAKQIDGGEPTALTVDQLVRSVVTRVSDSPESEYSLQLLLLLRTSGDEQADRIRRETLLHFAERMASAGTVSLTGEDRARALLRAQIVMAAALGITLLRSSSGIEPLGSATEDELLEPMTDLVTALLGS